MNINKTRPEVRIYNGDGLEKHEPTKGASLKQKIRKVVKYIFAKINFSHQVKLNSANQSKMKENTIYKKARRAGTLFGNGDIQKFSEKLGNLDHRTEGYITLSLFNIEGRNPAENIKQPENIEQRKEQKIIAYPFVFPGKGRFSVDHIVLIAVNTTDRKIYYVDSQGLSSDDPSRLHCFKDNRNFNMREDLEKLGRNLFGDEKYSIIENRRCYQKDPYNCGAFVMMGLNELNKKGDSEDFLDRLDKTLSGTKNVRQAVVDAFVEKTDV